jgi:hypothetical protein
VSVEESLVAILVILAPHPTAQCFVLFDAVRQLTSFSAKQSRTHQSEYCTHNTCTYDDGPRNPTINCSAPPQSRATVCLFPSNVYYYYYNITNGKLRHSKFTKTNKFLFRSRLHSRTKQQKTHTETTKLPKYLNCMAFFS